VQPHEDRSPETVVLSQARQSLDLTDVGHRSRLVEARSVPAGPRSCLGDGEGIGREVGPQNHLVEEDIGLAGEDIDLGEEDRGLAAVLRKLHVVGSHHDVVEEMDLG
jgi:hypothetical protein